MTTSCSKPPNCAFLICIALAGLLVVGVSESAKVNNIIVAIKMTVIIAFIVIVGWYVIQHFDTLKSNWDPFIPEPTGEKGEFGWGGILRAASIVFFPTSASKRSRPPGTSEESEARHDHRHIGSRCLHRALHLSPS